LQRRHQQANEDRDDANDDQHLDEGEGHAVEWATESAA
jgi:hypothetical protein